MKLKNIKSFVISKGCKSVEINPPTGRPLMKTTLNNIEHVRFAVEEDRCLTVRLVESDLGIPRSTVNLGMTRS